MDELLKQMLVPAISGLASAVGGYYLLAQNQVKANSEAKRQLEADKLKFEQERAVAREQFERESAIAQQRVDSDRSAAGLLQAAETQKVLDAARVQFAEKFERWLEECEGKYELKVAEANSLAQELVVVTSQRDNAEKKVADLQSTINIMEREIENLRQRVAELESRQGIAPNEVSAVIEAPVSAEPVDAKPKRRSRAS